MPALSVNPQLQRIRWGYIGVCAPREKPDDPLPLPALDALEIVRRRLPVCSRKWSLDAPLCPPGSSKAGEVAASSLDRQNRAVSVPDPQDLVVPPPHPHAAPTPHPTEGQDCNLLPADN